MSPHLVSLLSHFHIFNINKKRGFEDLPPTLLTIKIYEVSKKGPTRRSQMFGSHAIKDSDFGF